jgi:hypothetical protein
MKSTGDCEGGLPKEEPFAEPPDAPPRTEAVEDALTAPLAAAAGPVVAAVVGHGG